MRLRNVLVYASVWLIAGCATVSKEDVIVLQQKHDQALNQANAHIENAKTALATIPNPPAPVLEANGELGKAQESIGVAQKVSADVAKIAVNQAEKITAAEDDLLGPRGKAILGVVGFIVAVVGIIIAFVKFGGWKGTVLAVPLLGALLVKLNWIAKPK